MEIIFSIFDMVQRVLFDIFGVFRYSELAFCDEEQKLRRKTTKISDSSTINAFYFNFGKCLRAINATGKDINRTFISVTREINMNWAGCIFALFVRILRLGVRNFCEWQNTSVF